MYTYVLFLKIIFRGYGQSTRAGKRLTMEKLVVGFWSLMKFVDNKQNTRFFKKYNVMYVNIFHACGRLSVSR